MNAGQAPPHDLDLEWESLITKELREFLVSPEHFEDDGFAPPSKAAAHMAITLAKQLQLRGMRVPFSIHPEPDGGIAFIWEHGTKFVEVAIEPNGEVDFCCYDQ